MRFTIDSNILIYAVDAGTADKHVIAFDLMARAATADVVVTVQAIAEFLAVIGRKYPHHLEHARAQAARWALTFPLVQSTWNDVSAASAFASRHRLQFWDSVIWQTAHAAGATVFLSEDLQNGLSLDGMMVIDPLNPANAERIERLFEIS